MQTAFDELTKHMEKARTLITREGIPKFYVGVIFGIIVARLRTHVH